MGKQTIEKPLILEIKEAEKEAVQAVNEIMAKHKLPCSFFEPIIDKIHRQLIDGKNHEIDTASKQYEEKVAAESTKEE